MEGRNEVQDIKQNPISFDEDDVLDEEGDAEEDVVSSDVEDELEGCEVDDDHDAEEEYSDSDGDDVGPPERLTLMMPSSFDRDDILRLGLEGLAEQELELRKGQANDALEDLRLALGHKALLWRTKVHHSNTNKKRTRAWEEIKVARQRVEKHVRRYHRARRALIRLNADSATMLKYQVIKTTDLKLSGDVVDPSRLGQRNDSLPWFWRMEGTNADQDGEWMQECQ